MSKLVAHVVGARPNFMKAAPVIAGLDELGVNRHVIHTGQHYDKALSEIFFVQLGLPEPDINLEIGSGTHGHQTGQMIMALEDHLVQLQPDAVVVYGDVNSTVAAGLVCAKLGVPFVHVEAGLRSFDWTMPEEINRRVTDVLADLHLVTSPEGVAHLAQEGIEAERIKLVGNPMIDTLMRHRPAFERSNIHSELDATPGDYVIVTLHRPGNVDIPERAAQIVSALDNIGRSIPVFVPLHPRGHERLAAAGLNEARGVRVIEPLGYVEFMAMTAEARLVITDSGGVQEETTILDVPCLTVRPNTERPITIEAGTNQLVDPADLAKAAQAIFDGEVKLPADRPPLWDGNAGVRCARAVLDLVEGRGPQPRVRPAS